MNKAIKIKQDIFVTLGLTGFSIYIYFTAINFPKEAGAFPKLVSIFVMVLCLLQLILSGMKLYRVLKTVDEQEKSSKDAISKDFVITIITLIIYPILIFVIGFLPASLIYLVYTMYTYGYRKKVGIALVSGIVVASLYVIFEMILKINLPVGLLLGGL